MDKTEILWIGLNDARREGQWEWSSGEPVEYTHFDAETTGQWGRRANWRH